MFTLFNILVINKSFTIIFVYFLIQKFSKCFAFNFKTVNKCYYVINLVKTKLINLLIDIILDRSGNTLTPFNITVNFNTKK